MDDLSIEELIVDCAIKVFDTTNVEIVLTENKNNDYITVFFNKDDNKWLVRGNEVDFLSCVLLINQPHPNFMSDDNESISTLMKLFDKSASWLRSFQCGIRGISNCSTSITGYVCGMRVLKLYVECSRPLILFDDELGD